jgi:type IV pilus assembly protein PilM
MSFLHSITNLVKDPPPAYLFELSEAGIAFSHHGQTGFQELEPGTIVASPVEDNLKRPEAVLAAIDRIAPLNGPKKVNGAVKGKRRGAAVILPDYAARVTVLDFDSLPSIEDEQLSLVRFRVKKTIPFDIDAAALSYYVQPHSGKGKIEVVAVTVGLEIVSRYEALFRNAGFHPGIVTTSSLAALNLYRGDGITVLAKLAGNVLTVMALSGSVLKLLRCVALDQADEEEVLGVLQPTFAYVEDELGAPAKRVLLCGFPHTPQHLPCEAEPLRSRLGTPGAFNTGLLGYMEGAA